MQDLTLALIQTDVVWHNPEANKKALEAKIKGMAKPSDVIILPEMFTTGFTMDVQENAETESGPTLKWMQQIATQKNVFITGSIIIEEAGKFFNRLYWVAPNGKFIKYDKRHLFRMADEEKHFTGGESSPVVEAKGWKIKPLICYDLRFPVWSRNLNLEYDVLLFVANWPKARIGAWDTLLKARAIENLSYTVGVNRVGQDGIGIEYNGQSIGYDFKGEPVIDKTEQETILYVNLSKTKLVEYREKFPAFKDADSFHIHK